jgi:hypothetical protein
VNFNEKFLHINRPVCKVCIAQPRYRACKFDVFYIFTIKFTKSRLHISKLSSQVNRVFQVPSAVVQVI